MKENYKLLKSYIELSEKFYAVTATSRDISLQADFDQHLIEKLIDMGFNRTDEDSEFIRYSAFENNIEVRIVIEKN